MKQFTDNVFTERQLHILRSLHPGDAVHDIRVLKKLACLGVVTLHNHTGSIVRHVWGMLVRAWYIEQAETFEIPGIGIFHQHYKSGTFFPYLIKAKLDDNGRILYP